MSIYYPLFFNEAFEVYEEEVINKLIIAAFFCFNSINSFDEVLDNREKGNFFNQYMYSNMLMDETVKLLTTLFPISSEFWNYWQKRKNEFVIAYKMNAKALIKNLDDYATYAKYKSSFASIAIDSLYLLSKHPEKENIYKELKHSHDSHYVCFQVLDDIQDIEEDIQNDQFNMLHFYIDLAKYKEVPIEDIKSELYLSGVYEKCLRFGIEKINSAKIDEAHTGNLLLWQSQLASVMNQSINTLLNISGYVKEYSITNKLHNKINQKKHSVEEAINKGYDYILKTQEAEGSWFDYFNNAGNSDTWTTAFILASLPQEFIKNNSSIIQKSIQFLKNSKEKNKGWAYNSMWLSDADSTTFAFLAFENAGVKVTEDEIEYWLSYQNKDGGFSTYNNKEALCASLRSIKMDVSGWMQSHICVSAVAYYYLAKTGKSKPAFMKLKDFIKEKLKEKNPSSYWWTDFIYSINYIIKGAKLSGDILITNRNPKNQV